MTNVLILLVDIIIFKVHENFYEFGYTHDFMLNSLLAKSNETTTQEKVK